MGRIKKYILDALHSSVRLASAYKDKKQQDIVAQSVLLSYFLRQMLKADLQRGDQDYDQLQIARKLLISYKERHGLPYSTTLRRAAKKEPCLAVLQNAFYKGEISGYWSEGRRQVQPVKQKEAPTTLLTALNKIYLSLYEGVGLDEVAQEMNLSQDIVEAELLQDKEAFFSKGLFYPVKYFYQGENIYELIDELKREQAELQDTESKYFAKFDFQITFLQDLILENLPGRKLEGIPLPLHVVAPGGWLDLRILNDCPYIQRMGVLKVFRGRVFMDTLPAFRVGDRIKEVLYLTNAINQRKLTFQGREDGLGGVNSLAGKAWVQALQERWHNWLLTSEYRNEVETSFNRRFNGEIVREYQDAPFSITKLKPPAGFSPHNYQWHDVRKLLDQGRGLLAWKVGLGKTLAGIMLVCALKETGQANKPCIVCPKSLIGNWKNEIDKWSPDLKYIVVGLTQEFWASDVPAREVPGLVVIRDKDTGLPILRDGKYYQLKPKSRKHGDTLVELTEKEFLRRSELQFTEDFAEEKLIKLYQIAVDEYDLVLMWRETFKSIPLSPRRELAYLDDITGRHIPEDVDKKYFPGSKTPDPDNEEEQVSDVSEKETNSLKKQKTLISISEKRRQLIDQSEKESYRIKERRAKHGAALNELRGGKLSAEDITFEGLGIDCLIRDEAHDCRNLWSVQGFSSDTKGASINPSQRAYDFYMKSRYIRESNNGKNIFLLTATPVANTVLDIYATLQYLCDEELVNRGIKTVDEFISIFGKVGDITAPTMAGTMRTEPTLYGFQLLTELRSLFSKFAIIRTSADGYVNIHEPEENRVQHVVQMTPEQQYLYQELVTRMEEGVEMMRSGDTGDSFSDHPELQPFSVLADMDKLSLSIAHYLRTTIHGQKIDSYEDMADSLGNNFFELRSPISSYYLSMDETFHKLAIQSCQDKQHPVKHESRKLKIGEELTDELDWSDFYYEARKKITVTDIEKEIGTIGDYTEKKFDWRCELGCRRTILGVEYVLQKGEADSLNTASDYQWVRSRGLPYHSTEMADAVIPIFRTKKVLSGKKAELAIFVEPYKVPGSNELALVDSISQARIDFYRNEITELEAKLKEQYEKCRFQPGNEVTHQGIVYVFNEDYEWQKADGQPLYSLASPKYDCLSEQAKIYYSVGCIKLKNLDNDKEFITTPYKLFATSDGEPDVKAVLANWESLKVGDRFVVGGADCQIIEISGGNQIIFCDQIGGQSESGKNVAQVYQEITKQLTEESGIPADEIALVYGSISTEERQAIVQRYNAGDIRVVIGNTATLGEGLNMQGSLYWTSALYRLTMHWHPAAIQQGSGRAIRQGNQMSQVDAHFIHTAGTIDQFRYFVVSRKANLVESLLTKDEILLETDLPSLDEISVTLSADPVEAKKRFLEARQREINIQTQKRRTSYLRDLYYYSNCLSAYLSKAYGKIGASEVIKSLKTPGGAAELKKSDKGEWRDGEVAKAILGDIGRIAYKMDKASDEDFPCKHLLNTDKYLQEKDADFLLKRSGKLILPGDLLLDDQGRIYRINRISLRKRTVDITGMVGIKSDRGGETSIARTVCNDINFDDVGLSPMEIEERKQTSKFTRILSCDKNPVYGFMASNTETELGSLLKFADCYHRIYLSFTPEEMNQYGKEIKQKLYKGVSAPTNSSRLLLCWQGTRLTVAKVADIENTVGVDAIALPCDANFIDEMCRVYHLYRNDSDFKSSALCYDIHSLAQRVFGFDVYLTTLQSKGKALAADAYPTKEEVFTAIERWFQNNPTQSFLLVRRLIVALGTGRGIDYDEFVELLERYGVFTFANGLRAKDNVIPKNKFQPLAC
ncbi:MAG: SNF2-related protein [Crinalium sp.]